MPMSHKAFAFDWKEFEGDELYRLLLRALESDEVSSLLGYIDHHRAKLKDPYAGRPLEQNWQDLLENCDVHEYGDFALTRFYNPAADMGVAEEWMETDQLLCEADRGALLGFSIRSANNIFDPGRMGSYFQTPEQVSKSLDIVSKLTIEVIDSFKELLESCNRRRLGIYVTF